MDTTEQILFTVKTQVQEVLPQAKVFLFGSRANNTENAESDWDILILTPETTIAKETKLQLHNKIFPLSVSIGAFINITLVTQKDWRQNPSYYSLKKTVTLNSKVL